MTRLRATVTSLVCFVGICVQLTTAFTELPKFNQLRLLYPGWKQHGGSFSDRDVMTLVDALDTQAFTHVHNTAALRMSVTLNRYGGRHSLGSEPFFLTHVSRDSMTGRDGREYIYNSVALGPYLSRKYGDPRVQPILLNDTKRRRGPQATHDLVASAFGGKQGIVRLVSFHGDHAGGHVALWDCDHFHQSRDFSQERNLIAAEFWETPDSFCPTDATQATSNERPSYVRLTSDQQLVARHNFNARQQSRLIRHFRQRARYSQVRQEVPETAWLQDTPT